MSMQMEPERRQQRAESSPKYQTAPTHHSYERPYSAPRTETYVDGQKSQAQEHQSQAKLLEEHSKYIRDEWLVFQRVHYDTPPSLLPLEAAQAIKKFRQTLEHASARRLETGAINAFEADIISQAQAGEAAVLELKQKLHSVPLLAGLLQAMPIGKVRKMLASCIVTTEIPDAGSPAGQAITSTCRLLRKQWSEKLDTKQQAAFSIHRVAGRSIIHIGSSVFGSVFIIVPHYLDPQAIAAALLAEIDKAAAKLIDRDGALAIIDGDHQSINFQKVFTRSIVVRSSKDDCDRFASNFGTLLERAVPTARNSALHVGVPSTASELAAVFPSGGADWELWRSVAPIWQAQAASRGFERPASASAQQVVDSLTKDKNVIIVVAHAGEQVVHMPAPPPEGSLLSADQIFERRDEIAANKPVVYLFCCETAEIGNLKSFAQVLLDCGAATVVAPQTTIDAERSATFFSRLTDSGREQTILAKIGSAQRKSKYREMEVWLG